MPTIYDVARRAGVSPKTVSRVLNKEPNVRQSTLEAVRQAIVDLEYRPSTAARLMKSQRTKVVGFLTDRVVTSPESNAIARGVAEAAQAKGYTVIFVNDADVEAPLEGTAVNQLLDLKVDGLIYASHLLRQVNVDAFKDKNKPLVLANCFSNNGTYTSITPDDYHGGLLAGEMIIAQGHLNVAMLNLDNQSIAAGKRARGFLDAFRQAGLDTPPIVTAIFENAGTWDEHDYLPGIIDDLIARVEPPTALFCGNDKMAMVLYGLLAQRGLKVPDDVSVVGYDDFSHICQLLRPRLSSISIAHDVIGRRAFENLFEQINAVSKNQKWVPQMIAVKGSPILRASLAKI